MKNLINALVAGLIFGVIMGFLSLIVLSLTFAAVIGAIAFTAFSIGVFLFTSSKTVRVATQIELNGQQVIHHGRANHFYKGDATGGKLYLLSRKLVFKSHGFNLADHEIEISVPEMESISFFNSLGIAPNGLQIQLRDGSKYRFVVSGRKQWKNAIENQMH